MLAERAGGNLAMRRQIIIGQSQLQGLVGHTLQGLRFRRDVNVRPTPFDVGTLDLLVKIGAAALGPASAVASFEVNLPAPMIAFRGPVQLPASADATQRTPGWSGDDVIAIDFSSPYPYSGGPPAIDLEWTGRGTAHWPGDAWVDGIAGRVTSQGQACGPRTKTGAETSHAAAAELPIGATASVTLASAPTSLAVMLLGFAQQPTPIPLLALNSPNCTLDIVPEAAFATPTTPLWTPDPLAGGAAKQTLAIPSDLALLGATFFTQWIEFEQGAAITSNVLRCELADTLPPLELTTLQRLANGDVLAMPGESPVLALSWQ